MNADQCFTQQTNIFINISADSKKLIFEQWSEAQRWCDHYNYNYEHYISRSERNSYPTPVSLIRVVESMANDLIIFTHLIYIKGFLNKSLQTISANK